MSQSDHKLYLYDNNIDLVIGTDGLYVDNRPMNNRKLIAHKGLTNELIFSIRNRDRKLQNVFSDTLSAYLINPTTKRRLFYKLLEHTSNVGQVKLVLDEGDLRNVTAGLYRIYVAKQDVSGIDKPVYSDQNNGMVFDIQITEQIDQSPTPTQSANTFLQVSSTSDGDPANVFTTSAFSGNQNRNFPNALHSLAIYPDAYTGTLDVQASLVESVPSTNNLSTDWVTLESNIQVYHKFLTTGNIIITDSNIQTSTGSVTSLGLQSIIITDNENSNTEINSSNVNLTSATTLANVVSLINLAGNTNANVVASVVSTEDADANTKTYQLRLAGMDYTLNGQSIANVGIIADTYKKPVSNIVTKNYTINANWIRVLYTPTSGNISQVQVRN